MKINVNFSESQQTFTPGFGEINNISDGGYDRGYAAGVIDGAKVERTIVERSIDHYVNNEIDTIGQYAFTTCVSLITVSTPNVENLMAYAFNGCQNLENVYIPKAKQIGNYTFYNCKKLTFLQFDYVTSLGTFALGNCSMLETLVLGNLSVVTLANTNALINTPIAKGTGFVYVPDNLVNSYKTAANWSTYANQIKPISELPE